MLDELDLVHGIREAQKYRDQGRSRRLSRQSCVHFTNGFKERLPARYVSGDSFHCFDGVVLQVDENAARNVKARLFDPEIDRWTAYQKVKSILLERTERLRLGLRNQDTQSLAARMWA